MSNKNVSNALIVTFTFAIVLGLLESSMSPELNDGLTSLLGIAMLVFGIWAIIKLRK